MLSHNLVNIGIHTLAFYMIPEVTAIASTNFILYLYGMSQFSLFIDVIMNNWPNIKLIKLPICYCNMILLDMYTTAYVAIITLSVRKQV